MVFHYTFLFKWFENVKDFIYDDKNTEDVLFSMGVNLGIGFTTNIYA